MQSWKRAEQGVAGCVAKRKTADIFVGMIICTQPRSLANVSLHIQATITAERKTLLAVYAPAITNSALEPKDPTAAVQHPLLPHICRLPLLL